jgi:hypothetical protein
MATVQAYHEPTCGVPEVGLRSCPAAIRLPRRPGVILTCRSVPLLDLRSPSRWVVAAGTHFVVQGRRAARPAPRSRRIAQNQPEASPGLGRPSRVRRADPTPTSASRVNCSSSAIASALRRSAGFSSCGEYRQHRSDPRTRPGAGSSGPGLDHAGPGLLPRRLRSHPQTDLRLLRPGSRPPLRAHPRGDQSPNWSVDHPAGPQPPDGPRRPCRRVPVRRPRPRWSVHRVVRCRLGRRGDRHRKDSAAVSASELLRRTIRADGKTPSSPTAS